MSRTQRKYDQEYKIQAVKLAKEIGGAKAAKELGIPEGTIHTWLKAVRAQVYNDGLGNQAALNCDVYYLIDKEVKNIGTIESMGTAYPIAYDETGIYAASGHDMQRFEIEKSGSLRLAEGIYEQFDESGNAAYTMKKGEETDVITEEEYYAAFEKYSNATIVNFSYGASDAGKAEVVTNNELEPRQGNIAEDVNVLEIVQETASEFAVKKMETSYF